MPGELMLTKSLGNIAAGNCDRQEAGKHRCWYQFSKTIEASHSERMDSFCLCLHQLVLEMHLPPISTWNHNNHHRSFFGHLACCHFMLSLCAPPRG